MGKFVDLTGQRFGRLTAASHIKENGRIKWVCICDCGGKTVTTSTKLKSGHTQSCGCIQRERTSDVCKKDLCGMRFGKLMVISRVSRMGEKAKYKCKCDCGNTAVLYACNLVSGSTTSCGCFRSEKTRQLKLSHGQHGSRLYKCWQNMITRCENPNSNGYKNYGGRGISVCPEWKDFDVFYAWAMSSGYSDGLTIERIDVNGGYAPENCTWADSFTQSRNRTDNRVIAYNGKTMIVTDWANETGINEATIRHRLNKGWSVEDALTRRP